MRGKNIEIMRQLLPEEIADAQEKKIPVFVIGAGEGEGLRTFQDARKAIISSGNEGAFRVVRPLGDVTCQRTLSLTVK